MDRLLFIDQSLPFLKEVESSLKEKFHVRTATDGKGGLKILKSEQMHAVILDLNLPDGKGVDLIRKIHTEVDPELPIIIATDRANVENAVAAMRSGASDITTKDLDIDVLVARISTAIERSRLEKGFRALQGSLADLHDRIVFVSPQMRRVDFETSRLANLNFDVLIEGESGVGKDLIAHEIHQRSSRGARPFIPISMKSLSENLIESEIFGHERGAFSGADRAKTGKLEAAAGGTVYLPEISSLNESLQLKLLHFMQYKTISRVGQDPRTPERKLDVRIIMATNESIEKLVEVGRMRLDFYHRISGVKLRIPPLRERLDDIEPLANYFLEKNSPGGDGLKFSLAAEVFIAFKLHRWMGNVRELENLIKNALAYAHNSILSLEDFPQVVEAKPSPDQCRICMNTRFQVFPPYRDAAGRFKRAYFEEIIRRTGASVSDAALLAGLTPQGLRKILKSLSLDDSTAVPVILFSILQSLGSWSLT